MSVSMNMENREARSEKEKAQIEKANALLKLKKIEHKVLVDITNSVDAINNRKESIKLNKDILKKGALPPAVQTATRLFAIRKICLQQNCF